MYDVQLWVLVVVVLVADAAVIGLVVGTASIAVGTRTYLLPLMRTPSAAAAAATAATAVAAAAAVGIPHVVFLRGRCERKGGVRAGAVFTGGGGVALRARESCLGRAGLSLLPGEEQTSWSERRGVELR